MRLYESVSGHLRMAHGLFYFIQSTIGVKQGCSLSSTLFEIYIDELESFLHEHIQEGDGCLLHQVLISLLLFVDDLVLLASTPEGLQRQIDALANFCDLRQLMVNLGKTKVLIFNTSKSSLIDLHFYYQGVEIEITTLTLTWEYSSHDLVSVCDRPFSLNSVKGTVPWPSLRDSASWVSFRTSRLNSTSWRRLSDP
jgi:hypothetical protein